MKQTQDPGQSDSRRPAGARPLRILMLAQMVVYPPDAGPKVKALQVLRHLAARHTVIFCGFARTPDEGQQAEALRPLCHRVETAPLSRSRGSDLAYLAASLARGESFLLLRIESSVNPSFPRLRNVFPLFFQILIILGKIVENLLHRLFLRGGQLQLTF